MLVADLLRAKGSEVATVRADASLADLIVVLRNKNIGAAVVSETGSSIDGIVSERDIVRSLDTTTDLDALTVGDIMTRAVFTCSPSDRVEHLMAQMTERRIRHLPVAVDGELAGIVSIGDVVKSRVTELEHEARALTEYIQHGR